MAFLTKAANRGSIPTGYNVDYSCKFESDNAESLYKDQTQGTQTTWTFSTWLKRTELSNSSNSYHHVWAAGRSDLDNGTKFYFRGDASYPENRIFFYLDNGGSQYLHGATSQSFRDTAAWLHIVWAVDTTQSTASDRSKVYINGELQTLVGVAGAPFTNPPQNSSTRVNDNGGVMYVGAQNNNGGNRFNGYLAETVLIDGSQLAVTDFGEFDDDTGIWIPKDVSELSFGTRGFYLDYSDANNLGNDADGSTEFTESNITSADQATDTPTNNFAIGNANLYFSNPTFNTFNPLTEGATKLTKGANGWETLSSTIAVTSGKWYMEFQNITMPESAMASVFPADIDFIALGGQINNYAGKVSGDGGISYYSYNGNIYQNASNASYGSTWANETNTMAIALDMDNGKVYFARANVWQNSGDPTSGATGTGAINLIQPSKPHMMGYAVYANNTSGAVNFGGYTPSSISSAASDANGYGTFEYAPPSGYYALCSKNLAEFG